MDIEIIANEVLARLMEILNEDQEKQVSVEEKKYLKSGMDDISLAGYHGVDLKEGRDGDKVQDYDFFVMDGLSVEELVASSTGNATNDKTRLLRNFILNGKNVYIDEAGLEHRLYKSVSNPVYYTLFSEYEKKLKQYGIIILNKVDMEKELMDKYVGNKSNHGNDSKVVDQKMLDEDSTKIYSTEKKLVTSELAMELAENPKVILRMGTIITPFAKDVFKEYNTEIQFV